MGMSAHHGIEAFRQLEQVRLDGLKNAAERNKWGQFATPTPLAVSLARYARELTAGKPVRFFDPAIGTGSFFSALLEVFSPEEIAAAQGIELDPLFAETARKLWEEKGLEVVKGDFTNQPIPECRFNLVIANPPYVRHHHLTGLDKGRLKAKLLQSLNLDISGLAGLYCYFMLLCHEWMEEQGLAVWLVPSEFMDVNYGSTMRRYLTERVTLIHVHRFCPTDVQFTDALVSSAVVVFRKSAPPQGHRVRFSFGNAIQMPDEEAFISVETLRQAQKWTQFPKAVTHSETDELRLGDVFSIKRGLATGSNQFFIVSETDAANWQLPADFLKPILPSPRYLINDVIESSEDGLPVISPRLFLLDCRQSEEEIAARWPRFHEYLERGKEQGIHSSYLSSRRKPWYSQEDRPPAPFVCTYMGRSRDGKHPFRFIWNRSRATAHNVYLMLYPRVWLRNLLNENPGLERVVFEELGNIAPHSFISEGRVYGGGLHKVEPKELANIPVPMLSKRFPGLVCVDKQRELFA